MFLLLQICKSDYIRCTVNGEIISFYEVKSPLNFLYVFSFMLITYWQSFQLLEDLSHRLNRTRPFHPPLEGIGFEYGFNTNFLQTVLDFWKTKYSWKDRQAYLNSLPQFTTEVQGLQIHFIHVKPARTTGVSLRH